MKNRSLFLILFWIRVSTSAFACTCPLSRLSIEECNKYDIIFKGKIVSVKTCDAKPGEATFEIQEVYKGNMEKQFMVLFNCNEECAYAFKVGEEWIIYSNYKQINNAMMDWCSRSRRYFKNDKEDFYTVTYGNDYADEEQFLREKLGLHRVLIKKESIDVNRNQLPNTKQSIYILLASLSGILIFYVLFRKFVK